MNIHPTAVIEDGAEIGEGTTIGPFCVIGSQVKIGQNNILHSSVTIGGNTTLGDENEIFPYACLGMKTQDLKHSGGNPGVRIGHRNAIREYVTINCATDDGDYTLVGDNCLIQAYCHVAHDCILSGDNIVSSGAKISGHVELGRGAIVSGMTGIVQFVKIGEYAFIGGFAKLANDVPPYCIADGIPAKVVTINKIGLERNGVSKPDIRAIHQAFKCIYKSDKLMNEVKEELALSDNTYVKNMLTFIETLTKGLVRK